MHSTSMYQCQRFIEHYLLERPILAIADIGSMDVNGSYRDLFKIGGSSLAERWEYLGLDISPGKNVDVLISGPKNGFEVKGYSAQDTIPSWLRGSNSSNTLESKFDVIISGQCLEHVRRPWYWMSAVARAMKPGAICWITAPNTWEYHEHPVDCWRIWPDGLTSLFDHANLVQLECFTFGHDTIGVAIKAPVDYRSIQIASHYMQAQRVSSNPANVTKTGCYTLPNEYIDTQYFVEEAEPELNILEGPTNTEL